ncbi:FHA domain-containing protein, partial [Candidatus Woesearchaeota archaeon]|nr:FHA domain-containing protein [Candidatus Woesearchaeota archaeon]
MVKLLLRLNGNSKTVPVCANKNYFTIGRGLDNDLTLMGRGVSRYHAMIFRYDDDLYLIDYSLNGTYYNSETASFGPMSRLENTIDSKAFANYLTFSRVELEAEKKQRKLSKMPGYVEHKFKQKTDIEYLIEMVSDPEQAQLLCSS